MVDSMKHAVNHTQALAKYDWANKHIGALDAVLETFRIKCSDIIGIKEEPLTGNFIYYVRYVPAVPEEVSLIAGDILHNFRCALDYVFCGMLLAAGITPSTNAKFPIYGRPEIFEKVLPSKTMGLEEEVRNAIRRLRPYKGGNYFLWALHELNNTDKHRLLLTMSLTNPARSLTPREESEIDPAGQFWSGRTASGFRYTVSKSPAKMVGLREGYELLTVSPSEFYENMGFFIEVSINELHVGESNSISLLLRLIGNEVEHAIKDLSIFL
jgi:hypothetical protein